MNVEGRSSLKRLYSKSADELKIYEQGINR